MAETRFLHGWGLGAAVWAETLAGFAGAYVAPAPRRQGTSDQAHEAGEAPALHAVDLPGYGASPAVDPYTAESLADALAADIVEPVNLVGWSMGGMVALAVAARHPDKVRRLVLVATSPAFAARADWPHGMAPEVLAGFAHSLAADYRATLLRFLSLQARGGDAAREVIARLRERLRSQAEANPEVLAAGLELLRTVDLRGQVAQVCCPVLVVHGAYDTLCPPAAGAWLAGQLPDARLARHERAAHAPFLSHPEWFAATVHGFLNAEIPLPPRGRGAER